MEFCWVGLILFIPITWVVITVFEVQQGAFAVNGAARAAARAYALAPDDVTGTARAQAVVDQTLADQGGDGQVGTLSVSCVPYASNCHAGTSMITIRIDSGVTLPFLPAMMDDRQRSFRLTAIHTVPIGQFIAVPADTDEDAE